MAGEKARVTQQIVDRIQQHTYEDTSLFLENYKKELDATVHHYDTTQAEILARKIQHKKETSTQALRHFEAEKTWKAKTSLRETKSEQLRKLKNKALESLRQRVGTKEYNEFLVRELAKAPKEGKFMIREEDSEIFKGLDVEYTGLPLGGFKVVDGQRIYDYTLKSAFNEVFEAFSNSLYIDEQE